MSGRRPVIGSLKRPAGASGSLRIRLSAIGRAYLRNGGGWQATISVATSVEVCGNTCFASAVRSRRLPLLLRR